MDSTLDPWVIDPQSLWSSALLEQTTNNGNNQTDSNSNNNNSNNMDLNTNNLHIPDNNYYDIDQLLTEELRDLDIPIIPTDSNNNNINSGINNLPNFDNQAPNFKQHKRDASGTAIFGFLSHNKQLSISNTNDNIYHNTLDKSAAFNLQQPLQATDITTEPINNDISQLILRQQEELKLALERQKLVNEKLQEQLLANQLKQEQLQMALREKETIYNSSNHTSPLKTPRYNTTNNTKTDNTKQDNAIIVTSNSVDGKYQFPPPNMLASPPNSLNSPIRVRRNNNSYGNDIFTENIKTDNNKIDNQNLDLIFTPNLSSIDANSPIHSFPVDSIENNNNAIADTDKSNILLERLIKSNTNSVNRKIASLTNKNNNTTNILGPLNSPFYNPLPKPISISPHKRKDSILSTVSTIPVISENGEVEEEEEEGEEEEVEDEENYNNTRNNNNKLFTLPTIPQSTFNTPTKQDSSSNNNTNSNNNNNTTNSNTINNIILTDENSNNIPKKHIFQTTPIKKTIYEIPQPVEPHVGPLKITKKPTTLPPGTIDQYVKVLPDKLFECLYPNCGKIFKRRYNVRSHIQTHLKDKPYVCDFENCQKAFVRNHDLLRHKKSHLNKLLIFKCTCGKKFNNENNLKVHREMNICYKNSISKPNSVASSPRKSPTKLNSALSPMKKYALLDADNLENNNINNKTTLSNIKLDDELRNDLYTPENYMTNNVMDTSMVLTLSPPSEFSD